MSYVAIWLLTQSLLALHFAPKLGLVRPEFRNNFSWKRSGSNKCSPARFLVGEEGRGAMAALAKPLLMLGLSFVGVSGMELTPDNWDKETAGKTVLVKFQAPW